MNVTSPRWLAVSSTNCDKIDSVVAATDSGPQTTLVSTSRDGYSAGTRQYQEPIDI